MRALRFAVCVCLVTMLGSALGAAELVGTIRPLGAPTRSHAVTAPLGDLAEGLCAYLSFEDHLVSFDPQGHEAEARFGRDSVAFMPDLTEVGKGVPRYTPGKFEQGLLLEYGYPPAGTNQFPADIADPKATPANFAGRGEVLLEQATGLAGRPALRVVADGAGAGFATVPLVTPTTTMATFSLYVKGEEGTTLTLAARRQDGETPLGTAQVKLTGEWQRAFLNFKYADKPVPGHLVGPDGPPTVFEVTTDAPQDFLVCALMLDLNFGYAGGRMDATWMPGKVSRAGETVGMPPPPNSQAGTVSLWTNFTHTIHWRTILAVGTGGWNPNLAVDLYDQRRLSLKLPNGPDNKPRTKDVTLPQPLAPGEWHHFVLTWDGPNALLYLDGRVAVAVDNAPERGYLGNVMVGGLASHPATSVEGIVDEFAQWDRALSEAQVAELYARPAPLAAGIDISMNLQDREPLAVFARDPWLRQWHVSLANRGAQALKGAKVTYGVEGVFQKTVEVRDIPSGSAADVLLPWQPYLLRPGRYTMEITAQGGPVARELTRPIQIASARVPLENAQVINWGGVDRHFFDAGVTAGGLSGAENGPAPHDLETCVSNGMYAMYHARFAGKAASDADRFWDPTGKPTGDDQASPSASADATARAQRLGQALSLLPDVRFCIENTEHQYIWAPDFRPATIAYVKKRFGLDLTRWQGEKIKNNDSVAHPYGRLAYGVGGYPLPENGIVSLKDPFYAYSRWWQSGEVGNEVFLNDLIAREVRKQAPWVQAIWEPALRRPAVRVFKDQDILQEWYYYPNPQAGIWTTEALVAATRGTRQKVTGMPQFLFKPGMAAPYGGMPTPDMWRETVWLCMSRPIVGMTYWNLWSALVNKPDAYYPKGMQTQEDIDAILGPKPTWADAKAKISATSETSSLFLWMPELKDEITRLHHEDLHPIGALLPKWENRPRQLAIYRSFAGQMFNNIRWPGGGPLTTVAERVGQPFDILYDQDFEENPKLLDSYKVILAPENTVITEPAAEQLRAFLARGGKLIVDDYFKADLPGMTQVKFEGSKEDLAALSKREQELLAAGVKPGTPAYIEAMDQAVAAQVAAGAPIARTVEMVRAALQPEATTASSHVCLNFLRAGAANYVVAVNDLRVPGKYYGHFGVVLDQGVPQTVELRLDPALGKVAYALPQARSVALEQRGIRLAAQVDLAAGGGQVLVFLPEPIAKLALSASSPKPARGSMLKLSGQLTGQSGRAVPGIIPLRLTVTNPDGEKSDFSRYSAFTEGAWSLELPVELNATPGTYRAEVTDLASGQTQTVEWTVG